MANPPVPVERKKRLGKPGHRPLKAVEVAANAAVPRALAAPPARLGPSGRAMWRQVTAAAAGWVSGPDRAVLCLLCEAADRRAVLLAEVKTAGPVLVTEKGYRYANPAVGMVATVEKQMTAWLSLLGLTPTDRARLGLVVAKRASKLEELFSARQWHRG